MIPDEPRGIETRRALQRGGLPDTFTRSLYKISPYRGCAHGCLYCDGRAEKYFVEGDFERDILYRYNLVALLRPELAAVREKGIVSFGSGTTDPYQPCEARLGITRDAAALVAESGLPAALLTKSTLARRDIDIWKRINDKSGFILMVTVTTMDPDIAAAFEPKAPPPAERMAMVREFKEAGCSVMILAMPLLPGISDTPESMDELFSAATGAGADAIMPGGLTLRPGRQKELYLSAIKSRFPELSPLYSELYRENKPSGSPTAASTRAFASRVSTFQARSGLPPTLPHKTWKPMVSRCDEVHLLLHDMIPLYSHRGFDTKPLASATALYDAWLSEIRATFRRKRSLPQSWLDESLTISLETGNMAGILGNRKLCDFISRVVLKDETFDYSNLTLSGHPEPA